MKVLVIGNGGREHALVWKLKSDRSVDKIYCAPGNGGTAGIATNIAISVTQIGELKEWALKNKIDFTVVGPEAPLALGMTDIFEAAGLSIFGVNQKAAQLEASKLFTKNLLKKYRIPTPFFEIFHDPVRAVASLASASYPLVVKADGLASGKGVRICHDRKEALKAIDDFMVKKIFGDSSETIVPSVVPAVIPAVIIEEFLRGREVSYIGLFDGETFLPFESSQDYKKAKDNDEGANTGGMGAISPSPIFDSSLESKIGEKIVKPLISALKSENILYRGVLYIGLMVVKGDPTVLEFNVRFGDPEAEVLMARLHSDLLPLLQATSRGELSKVLKISWDSDPAVCVVMASKGYPESYETGFEIFGTDRESHLFHSGTVLKDGKLLTAGGRVLNAVARGKTLQEAIDRAYSYVSKIHWENIYFRKDIGKG